MAKGLLFLTTSILEPHNYMSRNKTRIPAVLETLYEEVSF